MKITKYLKLLSEAFKNYKKFCNSSLKLLRSSASHHVQILTLSKYIATGLGFLTTLIAARILGPEGYGQFALILSFPSLVFSLGSFKSITVSIRYISVFRTTRETKRLKPIVKLGYIIDICTSLIVFLIVLLIGSWVAEVIYKSPWMFWLMVLYASSYPFLALSNSSFAILTSFEEFRRLSALYILDRGISFFLVVTLLLAGYGVKGMVLGITLGNMLIGIISLWVATSFLKQKEFGLWWEGSLKEIAHIRQEIFSFFGWNYIIVTFSGILAQGPVILLGRIKGSEEAGFFRLAFNLMTISSYPLSATGQVVYPHLSARWTQEGPDSLKTSIKRWIFYVGIPLNLIVLSLIALFPFIVPLLLGENYRPIVAGAQILLLSTAVSALFFWLNPYYYATGQVRTWTKGFAIYTIFVLTLGLFVIPKWGFFGMAITFAIGKALFSIIMAKVALSQKFLKSKKEVA